MEKEESKRAKISWLSKRDEMTKMEDNVAIFCFQILLCNMYQFTNVKNIFKNQQHELHICVYVPLKI